MPWRLFEKYSRLPSVASAYCSIATMIACTWWYGPPRSGSAGVETSQLERPRDPAAEIREPMRHAPAAPQFLCDQFAVGDGQPAIEINCRKFRGCGDVCRFGP